ncbi:MAG: DNA replication complex GINS family protein [Thermoplasmata archaeon]|nr:DNA replication complex GINS family protein [Thermoplasmata archaeon]
MSDDDQFTVVSEAYRNERRSKVLTRLPTNFYIMSEEYLAGQHEEYSQAILIPSNPKTMMLQDQVKKVEKRLKHIYEIRERKIALAALDSMGGSKAPENMTKKDMELYDLLVVTLKSFRENTKPPGVPERPRPAPKIEMKPIHHSEMMPAPEPDVPEQALIVEPKPEAPGESNIIDNSIIVHVLEDIPNFVGIDHTYDLRKDDMVTLPSQFATLLSSKGKVRIVEG